MKTTPEVDSMLDLLRQIKGAPFTCLQAMYLAGEPVQARWLCEATGYSAGTVTQALKVLSAGGWVERPRGRRGWLPTPRLSAVGLGLARNNCDHPEKSDPYPTTTALTRKKSKPVVVAGTDRKKPDRLLTDYPDDEHWIASDPTKDYLTDDYKTDAALRKVLRNAGIGEPKASFLAGLPYVTVEYVCALHCKTRRLGQDARLLIYRIQQNDPLPERCHGGICTDCVLYDQGGSDRSGDSSLTPVTERQGYPAPGRGDVGYHPVGEPEVQPLDDPSLDLPANPGTSHSLQYAWQEVVRDLLEERPSAHCQAYLRGCQPLSYEPQAGCLVVRAADIPARDWLQARLATMLSRNLAGICCRQIEIRFVTE